MLSRPASFARGFTHGLCKCLSASPRAPACACHNDSERVARASRQTFHASIGPRHVGRLERRARTGARAKSMTMRSHRLVVAIDWTAFATARAACERELAGSSAHVGKGPRQLLLASLGRSQLEGEDHMALRTPGLIRRTKLEVASAAKVASVWERLAKNDECRRMFDTVDQYFDGRLTWDSAWEISSAFSGGLQNVASPPAGQRAVVYAGYAARGSVATALKDAAVARLDAEGRDQDDDTWDGHVYACAAYSGALPWNPDSDRAKRVAFWTWWLAIADKIAHDPDTTSWRPWRTFSSELGACDARQ